MRERYGYVYYNGYPACIDIDDNGFIVGHLLHYWVGKLPTMEIVFQEAIRLGEHMRITIELKISNDDALTMVYNRKYNLNDYIIEQLEDDVEGYKRWSITDKKKGGN